MKFNHISIALMALAMAGTFSSCNDFLDKEPLSSSTPETYYKTEDQVQACANSLYGNLPSHSYGYGLYSGDVNTDNQANTGSDGKYLTGQWKVGLTNGNWSWGTIRDINYKLNTCLANYEAGKVSGNADNIKQYIGEMYFLRAWVYFGMLRNWGDFPIITEAMSDNEEQLIAAEKRQPRNEVARFILSDLDKAMEYMKDNFESKHTRISKDVAMLVKSRVALYEGTFLNYFKGTPFVPCDANWPGKTRDYSKDYQYPTGSIDAEIQYFLTTAAEAAENIAEKYKGDLTQNNGVIPQKEGDTNPYFEMFGTDDMSGYKEVLLWRQYDATLGVTNIVEDAVQRCNYGTGVTRSMVESFLMEDGKPIYAEHDGYTYDDNTVSSVAEHRDPRLKIFLKTPGQINCYKNMDYALGNRYIEKEAEYPDITNGNAQDYRYVTGYCLRKGGMFDRAQTEKNKSANAACCFRAREALLNYMEAEYMLTHSLSGKVLEYWKIIREKAGFTGAAIDPNTTIAATDMSKETLDWGAYSAGRLLDDPILYNIRRERRDELMGENLRWMDLQRWRALDQMMTTRYHVEGMKLWNSGMIHYYYDPVKAALDPESEEGKKYTGWREKDFDGGTNAVVSSPSLSDYLRPYEKNMTSGNLYRDGYTWHMAHYLQPLPIKEMQLAAPDHATVTESPLYQNPYWSYETDTPAEK